MYTVTRGNKYNNVSQTYNNVTYHSRKEAAFAQELDLRRHAQGRDRIYSWRRQVKISLDVNGFHIANYYVDFEVTYPDGSIELIEIKGFETEIFRLKRKLLEATYLQDHPEVTYTIVR